MAARQFDPRPQTLPQARAFIRTRTRGSARADDVELAASELATNAIRHARTPFELSIEVAPKHIRVEVSDLSSRMPKLLKSGRRRHGLEIVASIAERWGVDKLDDGKIVWAEFDH